MKHTKEEFDVDLKGKIAMFENCSAWLSATATKGIRNNSVCVYHENGTVTNIRSRDDIINHILVLVDQVPRWDEHEHRLPEPNNMVDEGEMVRCLRLNISVF